MNKQTNEQNTIYLCARVTQDLTCAGNVVEGVVHRMVGRDVVNGAEWISAAEVALMARPGRATRSYLGLCQQKG